MQNFGCSTHSPANGVPAKLTCWSSYARRESRLWSVVCSRLQQCQWRCRLTRVAMLSRIVAAIIKKPHNAVIRLKHVFMEVALTKD